MKRLGMFLLLSSSILQSSPADKKQIYDKQRALLSAFVENKRLVVGANPTRGFFGCFFAVLNCLEWCEKNKILPVVHWGEQCLYYDKRGHNGIIANAWEYYFEPVSTGKHKKGDRLWLGFRSPEGGGISLLKDKAKHCSTQACRKKFNTLIKKYIKIKQPVMDKIESFYLQHMAGKKTIGLHLRGTDKTKEMKPVEPLALIQAANDYAAKHPGCQFLVATDEQNLLEQAQIELKGPVIFYEAHRSSNGQPIHFAQSDNKALLGEEVLIETLLLARCEALVHTVSNVSIAALYFNPTLVSILLKPE